MSSQPAPHVFTPAVVDGELHHVSASQIKTYELCPRKWWFGKVARVADTSSTVARDIGTANHTQQETWLRGGPLPTHPSAREATLFLPAPGPDLLVETEMVPPIVLAGVPWDGRIDVVVPPTPKAPTEAWVIDHKFTGNFKYCLSSAALARDTQMIGYAHWVGLRYWGAGSLYRGTHRVKVSHVYGHTKPDTLPPKAPLARRVDAWIPMTDIPAQWSRLTGVVENMKRDARKDTAEHVSGDRRACRAFGGCPYQSRCNVQTPKNLSGLMQLGRGPAPAPVPPSAPAPAPVAESVPPSAPAALTLYVGCVPLVGAHAGIARPLESLVTEYSADILSDHQVPDLRMIPYAAGKGLLASALRASPPKGVFFVYKAHELTAVALEALLPLADVVVQGV